MNNAANIFLRNQTYNLLDFHQRGGAKEDISDHCEATVLSIIEHNLSRCIRDWFTRLRIVKKLSSGPVIYNVGLIILHIIKLLTLNILRYTFWVPKKAIYFIVILSSTLTLFILTTLFTLFTIILMVCSMLHFWKIWYDYYIFLLKLFHISRIIFSHHIFVICYFYFIDRALFWTFII